MKTSKKLSLYVVCLTVLITNLSQSFYVPILLQVKQELETTIYMVNLTVTIFTIGIASMQLILGPIADRKGRKIVLVSGIVVFVIASLGVALSETIYQFLCFRLIQGAGAAAAPVVAAAIISDLFKGSERTKSMGFYQIVMALSPAIGPMIGGVIGRVYGYFGAFLFLSVCGAMILLPVTFSIKETKPEKTASTKFTISSIKVFFENKKGAAVLLICLFQFLASTTVLVFIPLIFQENYGLSPKFVGIAFVFMSISFMFSTKIAEKLEYCMGIERAFIIGCWTNVISILLFALLVGTSLTLAVILFCIFGVTFALGMPPALLLITDIFSAQRATAVAMYNLFRYAGMALGPIVGSTLYVLNNFFLLFSMVALLYGVSIWLGKQLLYGKKQVVA